MNRVTEYLEHPLAPWVAAALLLGILVGWLLGRLKGRPGRGALLGLLLGPVGWVLFLVTSGSAVRCQSCGRNTPWSSAPTMSPGMSEPHLRCRFCNSIVWGA